MEFDDNTIYFHNDELASATLVKIFAEEVSGMVLEVGAGIGHVTSELSRIARNVVAIEPTPILYSQLEERCSHLRNTSLYRATLDQVLDGTITSPENGFDAIFYLNVLEHIDGDSDEVRKAHSLLRPGGKLLVVVPAHQWLYSEIDRLTGHFRRYSKNGIRSLLSPLFPTVEIRYFDSLGLVPYFLIYKILRSKSVSGFSAKVYSRLIVRLSFVVYQISRGRLIGKNLIVKATK